MCRGFFLPSIARDNYYKQLLQNSKYKKSLRARHTTMKSRCFNPNAQGYQTYGGRGIIVCDEWLSFDGYWQWMQNELAKNAYRYNSVKKALRDLQLDRIDSNGNYEPNNCRLLPALTNSITQYYEWACIHYKDYFIPLFAFDGIFFNDEDDNVFARLQIVLKNGFSNKTLMQLFCKSKLKNAFAILKTLNGNVYYALDKPPLQFDELDKLAKCPKCKKKSVSIVRGRTKERKYTATCSECDFDVIIVNGNQKFYFGYEEKSLIKKRLDSRMLEILEENMPDRFYPRIEEKEKMCLEEFLEFKKGLQS